MKKNKVNDIDNIKKGRKKSKKNKKRKKIARKILLFIAIVLLVVIAWFIYKTEQNGGGLSGALATVIGHDQNTKKNLGELKVLLVGVSTDIDAKLSDTIIVCSYNPNTQKATLLSIPRDTYTGKNKVNATANDKINAIYSYTEDPEKLLKAVNDLTGLNIPYYLVIETQALREVVDAVGGVTFDVPIDMDYDDSSQDLYIHLKKGEQLLDGEKAEWVVRFRHNNDGTSYSSEYGDNDTGRMRTQREFLKTVMKQVLKTENIFKLGEFLEILNRNVTTNIDLDVAKDYLPYAVEFDTENLLTDTLPGENYYAQKNGVWIFVPNKTQITKTIQKLFYDRDLDTTEEVDPTERSNIKIEIINSSGSDETLEAAVEALTQVGYKIKSTQATKNTVAKTVIINQGDVDEIYINNIQDLLLRGEIQNVEDTTSDYDIKIILGEE